MPERPIDLDGEGLLQRVRGERGALVPFIGAGLAQGACAPSAADLSQALADLIGSQPTAFPEAVRAAERLSVGAVRTAVAEIFAAHPCSPTALLTRLAQWPARRILTTNYDDAVELSVAQAGLEPVVLDGRRARALSPPDPGTVQVIHLHGWWTEPSSMVLPGQTTSDLREDELFMTNLRALLQQHAQVFLGFSLSSCHRPSSRCEKSCAG